jgi:hypothetical protein
LEVTGRKEKRLELRLDHLWVRSLRRVCPTPPQMSDVARGVDGKINSRFGKGRGGGGCRRRSIFWHESSDCLRLTPHLIFSPSVSLRHSRTSENRKPFCRKNKHTLHMHVYLLKKYMYIYIYTHSTSHFMNCAYFMGTETVKLSSSSNRKTV